MKLLTLKSPAKLNLYLEILNKRSDGFHNLKTVFERISLCDEITLIPREDKSIKIICDHSQVPTGSSNIAFKAARLLKEDFSIKQGLEIRIKKKIPLASGLGGGSSNAATVLLGLNRLWKLNLGENKLVRYAKRLGSDVAFFIYQTPFALGEGRGDQITPLKNIRIRLWHILVIPRKKISTKLAYNLWGKNKTHRLTTKSRDVKILLLGLRQDNLTQLGGALFNSFDAVTPRICPDIIDIKCRLEDLGLKAISMSGKGPAIFGMVSSRKEALACKRQLEKHGWTVLVVKTF